MIHREYSVDDKLSYPAVRSEEVFGVKFRGLHIASQRVFGSIGYEGSVEHVTYLRN